MVQKMIRRVNRAASSVALAVFAIAVALQAGTAQAQTTPVLPDTGVDMTEYVTAFGAALGPVVGAAVLLACAFLLIRVGYRWIRGFVK
jgi:hypothetical protein